MMEMFAIPKEKSHSSSEECFQNRGQTKKNKSDFITADTTQEMAVSIQKRFGIRFPKKCE